MNLHLFFSVNERILVIPHPESKSIIGRITNNLRSSGSRRKIGTVRLLLTESSNPSLSILVNICSVNFPHHMSQDNVVNFPELHHLIDDKLN